MKIKEALKSLKNFKWVAATVKPFIPAVFLIILIESLTSLTSVAIAITTKNIIDFATQSLLDKALLYTVFFAVTIIFNLAAGAFLNVYSVQVYEKYSIKLRQDIFSRLINMEWLQVSKYHSGDLLTRLTSDIGSVANGSIRIPAQIIALGVQLTAAFATLLHYEPGLAILAFFLAPFTVIASRYYGKKLSKLHLKMQETESSYRSHMQEYLQNLLVLKTFNLEEKSIKTVEELQNERLHWVTERSKTGVIANTVMGLGYWIGYFLAFVWGAFKLANKATTFGKMTAFLQLVNQIQSPFIGLSRTLPQVIAAMASAGRLIELEELNAEVKGDKTEIPYTAGITFNNVSFQYTDNEKVLESVTMKALPGEIVALVGTSGEGKTTMIRLMLALLKPDQGEIKCFDGKGTEHYISSSTRNWFSYVPQGNTLFSGTVAENLLSGKNDANEVELNLALKAACALDFVEKLQDGMNTVIGEKACGLSEGQAQRIAIARALLRNAPIIILDEATSALDMELEEKVLKGISELKPPRTCIMITHRKSALYMCDKVYKLKDGVLSLEELFT